MFRKTMTFSVVVIFFILILSTPAYSKIRDFSMYDCAEESDVVFVGETSVIGENSAAVKVKEVISGDLDSKLVYVKPIDIFTCTGRVINFKTGELSLIFGKKTGKNQVTLAADGQGKRYLDPNRVDMEIAAAKRIIEIAAMKDEDSRNKAMLSEVKSPNERIRFESRMYIYRVSQSKLLPKYKDDFLRMLNDPDADLQRRALYIFEYLHAEDAVPRICELSRSNNLDVVEAASMAISKYDTPDAIKADIDLLKNKEPRVRIRACLDNQLYKRSGTREALKALMYDHDPNVRAEAPKGVVEWLRDNEAADIVPRLVDMLDDPYAQVRASAALSLGETRDANVVGPLLAALKKQTQDEEMTRWTLDALYCHYSKDEDSKAKALIDNDINTIVKILKLGGPHDSSGPSFHAIGILDLSSKTEARNALAWAAHEHPNSEIRDYAQRCLKR